MSGLILPYGRRRSHPLRDKLGTRDEKTFRDGVAMTDAVARAVQRTCGERGLDIPQVLETLLTTLVAFVQSQAPSSEWDSVGVVLADELRARLTVTGDSGDDDHRRKMV